MLENYLPPHLTEGRTEKRFRNRLMVACRVRVGLQPPDGQVVDTTQLAFQ